MIALAPVIAALKASGTPFRFVGGALDLVTAGDHLKVFPAAYALPMADSAAPSTAATVAAVDQTMSERFAVMYAVRNVRAGAGDKAQEELRAAVEWARAQVAGMDVGADYDLVEFEGGEMNSFADEIAIWNDRFITTRQLRKV